jgi:tetratricopeptide (TPR) repeat protein
MRTRLPILLLMLLAAAPAWLGRAGAAEADSAFDAANKLYEQGRFQDAAEAYESVLPSSFASPALYFNEGNAWFKSGQIGRALVAYRRARELAPHDADLMANLQFVRNQVQGPTLRAGRWQNWLETFTLDEWTWLAALAVWGAFTLLVIMQIKPALKPALRSWTVLTGCAGVLLCTCLGFALAQWLSVQTAVVITPDVTVRTGPFKESQSAFIAHDGAELRVLDRKDDWLQVTDGSREIGWIKQDSAIVLKSS